MNRMARAKLLVFTVGVVLFGITNPPMLLPCLAVGLWLLERQSRARREYNRRRRIRRDADYLRMFR